MLADVKEWLREEPRQALALGISAVALLLSFLELVPGPVDPAWLAVLLCGVPIIKEGAEGLFTRFDIKADVLVSMALLASVIIGEIFAAGEVAFIMQLGALLEERTVAKARAGIERLVHLTPRTARRLDGSAESIIPAEEVRVDDLLRVLPGETIPVDGIIVSGQTAIDQSVMTGESLPVDKGPGDAVSSGTVNQFGAFDMRAVKVGEDSSLQRMIRLVQSADAGKARIVSLADRWATWIVAIALVSAGGAWMATGELIRAVTILVVFCPCALVLATPTAVMAAIGNATRHGFLVREGDALERLSCVSHLTFDKTGTLTQDHIVLERHVNVDGTEDKANRILRHAYFNSYFQTGLKNLMDRAILSHVKELGLESLSRSYKKVDEIPFDFQRRRMSVVVEDLSGKRQIITKGAVEEMLGVCSHAEFDGKVLPLTKEMRAKALRFVKEMNELGMRVLALAQKSFLSKENNFAIEDEKDMVLIGYLAFLDPPKESASQAIKQLHEHGVEVKVLSGDNDAVVKSIARQVGIDTANATTGPELEVMSQEAKTQMVEKCSIFSKLTPMQKAEIIQLLQKNQNTVGFLGDGINDAAALRESDIGISVDSAVDIAKESADIILLEKDLMVLENGVLEGRKTFGNIVKYVKMTASSNFGNMFSVLAASAFLPFLPMLPIHLLIQNLLYDISQTTIPFDRMDSEYLRRPRIWDSGDLSRFMIWIGPISSIFDIATYLVMWWVFKCQGPDMESLFQSGWFVEGLLSQTLIVHMIRTRKVPFVQSSASWPVMLMTFSIMAVGICIPFTPFGSSIGLTPLPLSYFPWLVGILLAYCVLTQWLKTLYIHVFKRWL